MSEITSENFFSELPIIETKLKDSAFVCFDLEFSKLNDEKHAPFTFFDTLEERYHKLHLKVSDITCIQLGLSFFVYDAHDKVFQVSSYSFYTFPKTYLKYDGIIKFQTSCVEFLCKHNFNFNKLFNNGISYLTDEQENQMKLEMADDSFSDSYLKKSKYRIINEEMCHQLKIVTEWYENAIDGDNISVKKLKSNDPVFTYLLQYHIMNKCEHVCLQEDLHTINIIKITSKDEKSNTLNAKNNEASKQILFKKMLGIKHLLNLLSETKKPLVGHNCAMDILILCNQFYNPLPDTFKEYKSFLSNKFGPIYDTKLMCKTFRKLLPKNGNEMKLHHAGWDAYYTGYCFVKIIHITKNFSSKTENVNRRYTLTELLKSVDLLKNKMFTSRLLTNCIDLEADDNNVLPECLIIKSKGLFPKSLKLSKLKIDMHQIICNYDMRLISNSAVLIGLPVINNRIISEIKSKYTVEKYSKYKDKKKKQYLSLSIITLSCVAIALFCLRK
ncbi:pre-piRNA 3'-exonuclease trimmer-like isoform X2 [Adelges cooleyi]|uniref:pre-piRNA 3'-exonuclease trimmer-like isoform X2 n=1 Tax=Adelges cooleyi TaxID=133065 RepID=UPI00217FD3D8|nr:pre-piRNA 3'-exonuclease trimmer-like isoform X2 [Adelges cooleyi]